MKAEILSVSGSKIKEIELPRLFSDKIREDILKKVFEAEKSWQAYAPYFMAGRQTSASGIARHKRHSWKSGYGHGRSRVPRKIMWRRGTQFYWIGAEVSGTRGGRRAHPPKVENMVKDKKINKKEYSIALASAISSSINKDKIEKRYERLKADKIKIKLPIVIEDKVTSLKTKEFIEMLKKILGNTFAVAIPEKTIRAGKGKLRNRKYKKSAGVLIILGNNEKLRSSVVENKKVSELEIKDLYPAGRLVIYTENAIKDLEKMGEKK